MAPSVAGLLLTPIAPHTLSFRPVVIDEVLTSTLTSILTLILTLTLIGSMPGL